MYPITAGGGGVAEQDCSLGRGGEGEGGVAYHRQLSLVGGGCHQLFECGIVNAREICEMGEVVTGKLFQDDPFPQGWIFGQGPLHNLHHICCRLEY